MLLTRPLLHRLRTTGIAPEWLSEDGLHHAQKNKNSRSVSSAAPRKCEWAPRPSSIYFCKWNSFFLNAIKFANKELWVAVCMQDLPGRFSGHIPPLLLLFHPSPSCWVLHQSVESKAGEGEGGGEGKLHWLFFSRKAPHSFQPGTKFGWVGINEVLGSADSGKPFGRKRRTRPAPAVYI